MGCSATGVGGHGKHSIIEPSISDWAALIVLMPKKDALIHLCVDFRWLNSVTQTDAYPIPRVDDMLHQIESDHYITTLDLTWGYWQIPLAADAHKKTAFLTPLGLYQFMFIPFGWCGASATFQRLMDQLLRGLGSYSAAYLEDIVIYSNIWEAPQDHICSVLWSSQKCRHHGETLEMSVCHGWM